MKVQNKAITNLAKNKKVITKRNDTKRISEIQIHETSTE